jgi:hypothetical protein
MVEISSSGSGGGSGWATAPGYPISRPREPQSATRDPGHCYPATHANTSCSRVRAAARWSRFSSSSKE